MLAVSLNGYSNSLIQYAVEDRADASSYGDVIRLRKFLNCLPQGVIVCNNLDQVKTLMEPLQPMDLRGSVHRLCNQRLFLSLQEGGGDIFQQRGNVTASGGRIQISNCRNMLHLASPDAH